MRAKDLNLLIASEKLSSVLIFDVKQDRNQLLSRLDHPGDIRGLSIFQSAFFSIAHQGTARRWRVNNLFDIQMEKETKAQFAPSEYSQCFDVASNGQVVVGPKHKEAKKIIVEDLARGTVMIELEGHKDDVWTLMVDRERHRLYSGGKDKLVIKWNLASYSIEKLFRNGHSGGVTSIVLPFKGQHFVSASADKFLNLYETRSYKHVGTVKFETAVFCLEWVLSLIHI